MMNNLIAALQITLLGMALVFLAIIVLWLMMRLLTAIPFKDQDSSTGGTTERAVEKSEPDLSALAAAAAVAIALEEQSQSTARPLPEPPTAIVSAWQLGMRTRQMYEKGGH
ncbi:MAG: OadG family protein [Chloroflexota bacterium]